MCLRGGERVCLRGGERVCLRGGRTGRCRRCIYRSTNLNRRPVENQQKIAPIEARGHLCHALRSGRVAPRRAVGVKRPALPSVIRHVTLRRIRLQLQGALTVGGADIAHAGVPAGEPAPQRRAAVALAFAPRIARVGVHVLPAGARQRRRLPVPGAAADGGVTLGGGRQQDEQGDAAGDPGGQAPHRQQRIWLPVLHGGLTVIWPLKSH